MSDCAPEAPAASKKKMAAANRQRKLRRALIATTPVREAYYAREPEIPDWETCRRSRRGTCDSFPKRAWAGAAYRKRWRDRSNRPRYRRSTSEFYPVQRELPDIARRGR